MRSMVPGSPRAQPMVPSGMARSPEPSASAETPRSASGKLDATNDGMGESMAAGSVRSKETPPPTRPPTPSTAREKTSVREVPRASQRISSPPADAVTVATAARAAGRTRISEAVNRTPAGPASVESVSPSGRAEDEAPTPRRPSPGLTRSAAIPSFAGDDARRSRLQARRSALSKRRARSASAMDSSSASCRRSISTVTKARPRARARGSSVRDRARSSASQPGRDARKTPTTAPSKRGSERSRTAWSQPRACRRTPALVATKARRSAGKLQPPSVSKNARRSPETGSTWSVASHSWSSAAPLVRPDATGGPPKDTISPPSRCAAKTAAAPAMPRPRTAIRVTALRPGAGRSRRAATRWPGPLDGLGAARARHSGASPGSRGNAGPASARPAARARSPPRR